VRAVFSQIADTENITAKNFEPQDFVFKLARFCKKKNHCGNLASNAFIAVSAIKIASWQLSPAAMAAL
jgi:hypothetical protein